MFRYHKKYLTFAILVYLLCTLNSALASKVGIQGLPAPYNPIDDKNAHNFVKKGLAYAKEFYGDPVIPVKKVQLCLDAAITEDRRLKGSFPRCDLTFPDKGIFTIYLSRTPREQAFYGQLSHEIGHLLNTKLFDCYTEGLNSVFAEELLRKEGKDWSVWIDHYKANGDPFYAATYFMMKDIYKVARFKDIKSFLKYAVSDGDKTTRMHIDIDKWLDSIPDEKSNRIRRIIKRHAPAVHRELRGDKRHYTFMLPNAR
ncbi:hypothetical protein ACFL28_02510 [Candidatus Omnitrophota bacterium]